MTSVAWDGHVLAADKRITTEWRDPSLGSASTIKDDGIKIELPTTKVSFRDSEIQAIAYSGNLSIARATTEHLLAGKDVESHLQFLATCRIVTDHTTVLIICRDCCYKICVHKKPEVIKFDRSSRQAIGSSWGTPRTIMDLGLSAPYGVAVAKTANEYVGPQVEFVCLPPDRPIEGVKLLSADFGTDHDEIRLRVKHALRVLVEIQYQVPKDEFAKLNYLPFDDSDVLVDVTRCFEKPATIDNTPALVEFNRPHWPTFEVLAALSGGTYPSVEVSRPVLEKTVVWAAAKEKPAEPVIPSVATEGAAPAASGKKAEKKDSAAETNPPAVVIVGILTPQTASLRARYVGELDIIGLPGKGATRLTTTLSTLTTSPTALLVMDANVTTATRNAVIAAKLACPVLPITHDGTLLALTKKLDALAGAAKRKTK